MRLRAWSFGIVLVAAGLVGGVQDFYESAAAVVESFDKIGAKLKTIETPTALPPLSRTWANGPTSLSRPAKAAKLQPPEKDEKARLKSCTSPSSKNR